MDLSHIDEYRIENDLTLETIAGEIGVSVAVYLNNVTGRMRNGEFYKSTPNARNMRKFERWISGHKDEIESVCMSS